MRIRPKSDSDNKSKVGTSASGGLLGILIYCVAQGLKDPTYKTTISAASPAFAVAITRFLDEMVYRFKLARYMKHVGEYYEQAKTITKELLDDPDVPQEHKDKAAADLMALKLEVTQMKLDRLKPPVPLRV